MPTVDVRGLAPDALEAFERAVGCARSALPADLYDPVRARVATLLQVDDPLAATSSSHTDVDPAVIAFTEQYIVDVAAVTEEQRAALGTALGEQAATFSQTLYTLDYDLRIRAALGQLFGGDPLRSVNAEGELWPTLEVMLVAIAKLQQLDPMTTELVRLRGARFHNCRFCQSVRNVRAADQAGDDTFFDQVDRYETSDLAAAHKVALRLTDAIYLSPAQFPDGLVADVHRSFEPAQVVEIVLDIARNALNKSAVALGVDGDGVGDELHYYDTAPDGNLVYGLSRSTS